MKDFTSQQREIVARKLGYDGPMQGFDEFIASSPALGAKYAAITGKFAERMAKGGLVKMKPKPKGYAAGGSVTDAQVAAWWATPANQKLSDSEIKDAMDTYRVTPEQFSRSIGANTATATDISTRYFEEAERDRVAAAAAVTKAANDAATALANAQTETQRQAALAAAAEAERLRLAGLAATAATTTGGVTGGGNVTFSPVGGTPQAAAASQVKPEKIVATEKQNIDTTNRAGTAETIKAETVAATTLAALPSTTIKPETMTASKAATDLKTALDKIAPADGTLTAAATVKPEEQWDTAITEARKNIPQIETAQKVAVVPDRTLGAAETVTGSAVDATKVATELAKAEAAQGVVTEDMTVQGQLAKLTKNFDATNPPSWAAGALRAVTAEMSARGLGASSLAGAALVHAALEKALPIASADAAIYQQFASQNLSNKQQIAVLVAQQRATFLGQEFDQNFQTRVVNATRVSEIANLNFSAKQQIALENSKLAQSVDLANLSGRQASFMAELAQTATLETASLNNRQQAAVVNAQAALQIDLTNMSYEQQTTVLKTQLTAQAILSDAAADNAAKQFNAASTNQTNQFFESLKSQVSQFNSAQSNGMEQFRVDQTNAVSRFNAEVKNLREQFNAQQRLVIDQSNAQWLREIATINTGAINTINLSNAQFAQQMTLTEYNNEIQMYRDAVTHAWTSAEKDADRATTLAAEEIRAAASVTGANIKADGDSSAAIGAFVARVLIG